MKIFIDWWQWLSRSINFSKIVFRESDKFRQSVFISFLHVTNSYGNNIDTVKCSWSSTNYCQYSGHLLMGIYSRDFSYTENLRLNYSKIWNSWAYEHNAAASQLYGLDSRSRYNHRNLVREFRITK